MWYAWINKPPTNRQWAITEPTQFIASFECLSNQWLEIAEHLKARSLFELSLFMPLSKITECIVVALRKHLSTPNITQNKINVTSPVPSASISVFENVTTAGCNTAKNCIQYPIGCQSPDCQTLLTWKTSEPDYVDFEMMGVTGGWVAFGLSLDQTMVRCNSVISVQKHPYSQVWRHKMI